MNNNKTMDEWKKRQEGPKQQMPLCKKEKKGEHF